VKGRSLLSFFRVKDVVFLFLLSQKKDLFFPLYILEDLLESCQVSEERGEDYELTSWAAHSGHPGISVDHPRHSEIDGRKTMRWESKDGRKKTRSPSVVFSRVLKSRAPESFLVRGVFKFRDNV